MFWRRGVSLTANAFREDRALFFAVSLTYFVYDVARYPLSYLLIPDPDIWLVQAGTLIALVTKAAVVGILTTLIVAPLVPDVFRRFPSPFDRSPRESPNF